MKSLKSSSTYLSTTLTTTKSLSSLNLPPANISALPLLLPLPRICLHPLQQSRLVALLPERVRRAPGLVVLAVGRAVLLRLPALLLAVVGHSCLSFATRLGHPYKPAAT